MTESLLVVEDDSRLAEMLTEYLRQADYAVTCVAFGHAALAQLAQKPYDAVVLDVMLPDIDGLEVCRRLRASDDTPVLMLTARGDAVDRIVGLELGADDYLPKPFEPRELLARLRAIIRRRTHGRDAVKTLRFGRLELDSGARSVRLGAEALELTSYQFDLLLHMARNAGRVLSRDALMDHTRGHAVEAFDRSIDVHISRIRSLIEDDPKKPRRIITVRSAGYVFAKAQD